MADKKKTEANSVEDTKAADRAAGKKAKAAIPAEVPRAAIEAAPRTKSAKIQKLSKKNKHRLPRREKKARQKAAAGQSGG